MVAHKSEIGRMGIVVRLPGYATKLTTYQMKPIHAAIPSAIAEEVSSMGLAQVVTFILILKLI